MARRPRPGSDIDIAVYLDSAGSADTYLDLSLDLSGRLAKAARLGAVELVVMNGAPRALLGRILKNRIVIYSRDEPARVAFESRSLSAVVHKFGHG